MFVTDSSPEAETVTRALRAAGHTVVDVVLSMLVARVAVQRPRIVLVDADAEGALEIVERMRELPNADDIHVLFVACAGGVIANPEEALAHEGSGLFIRPIDMAALLQKVQLLADGARAQATSAQPSPSTPAALGPPPRVSSSPPSLPPVSMRASIPPAPSEPRSNVSPPSRPARSPSDPPPGGVASRRVSSLAPPVSSELQQLLAEAEQRIVVTADHESLVPSPEEEIEAVLPADLLAALDEPLDEDEDDEDLALPPRSARPSRATRERTSARAGPRAARTSPGEGGSTSSFPARTGPGTRSSETPAVAHENTPGGTQAEPSGEGVSTTGGSDARGSDAAARPSDSPAGAAAPEPLETAVLGAGDAIRIIARAIASRTTASLCVVAAAEGLATVQRRHLPIERRVVLHEGDVVTASSTAEEESVLAFLGARGDLPRETVRRLSAKFPAHGRHAGAALVARGYLPQDQMWPTLRAHAEWVLARALQTANGRLVMETQPPGRLGAEPSVFGGSTGAGVFVDVVRRIVSPSEAIERFGGIASRVVQGPELRLLDECALEPEEADQVREAPGRTVRDVVDAAPEGDLVTVLFALWQLGVLEVLRAGRDRDGEAEDPSAPDVAALDAEAVRERVRARLQLVEDGDYFALLGVPRDATGYEVRRAFLELRRAFEPGRVLTPEVIDLAEDVRKIAAVIEEAYDVLKDGARRERYRRAIEAVPEG